MMGFQLLYDIEQAGYQTWGVAAVGLFFVLVSPVWLVVPGSLVEGATASYRGRNGKRFAFLFFFCGGGASSALFFLATYLPHLDAKRALQTGHYRVVEGA